MAKTNSSEIVFTAGKPVNLSTNCSKHILVEAKHAHVAHVGSVAFKEKASVAKRHPELHTIGCIQPPHWDHSLFKDMLQSVPASSLEEDKEEDKENQCLEDAHSANVLSNIEKQLDRLELQEQLALPKKPSRARETGEIKNQLKQLSASLQDELQPEKRKPRGNCGFFQHLSNTRATLPRMPGESKADFQTRAREEARKTWKVSCIPSIRFLLVDVSF